MQARLRDAAQRERYWFDNGGSRRDERRLHRAAARPYAGHHAPAVPVPHVAVVPTAAPSGASASSFLPLQLGVARTSALASASASSALPPQRKSRKSSRSRARPSAARSGSSSGKLSSRVTVTSSSESGKAHPTSAGATSASARGASSSVLVDAMQHDGGLVVGTSCHSCGRNTKEICALCDVTTKVESMLCPLAPGEVALGRTVSDFFQVILYD